MASPLTRNTIVGVAEEVTEGTYVAPTATDVVQVVDFPTFSPERETIERNVIKGSIGRLKPLKGIKAGTVEFNVELRAAGTTASVSDAPEIDLLLESALGAKTSAGNSVTVGGSTDTLIELDTGDGASFAVGDVVLIDGEVRFVLSVSGDQITLNRALTKGAPAASVTVNRGTTYKPATSGHKPLSITGFLSGSANAWEQRMIGCRCSSWGFTDFATGQIPKLTFTFDVLDHTSVAGTTIASPVYEDTVPPVALAGDVYKDATSFCVNSVELTAAQVVTAETCLNTSGGRNRLFVTDRNITGTFDPFVDDSDVTIYTEWNDNTDFAIQVALSTPDSSGDFVQGTCVAVWLPQVNYTTLGFNDNDGTVAHELGFSAHESATLNDDIYIGFV